MAHAEYTVTVDKPIGEVFAFLSAGTNEAKWRPEVIDISQVEGTGPGVGAQFEQTMKGPGGRKIAGDFEYTAVEEPTRIDFKTIAGPARPTGSFILQEKGSSTDVTFVLDLVPRGLMKLMAPMINKQVQAEVRNLDNLASALGA
jgi:uncharacterized protein YndB with AHSA1/START domain